MVVLNDGGGQGHVNAEKWKLRWKRRWTPEPPRWHWWDVAILLLAGGGLLWWLVTR